MSDSSMFEDLFEQIPEQKRQTKYLSRLTPVERQNLDHFEEWLVAIDGKTATTAKAYKTYVAQAMCHFKDGGTYEDLSTDIRSGINAVQRFASAIEQIENELEAESDDEDVIED